MASSGTSSAYPRRRARSIANAVPTAFGRWLAMVDVCGGIHPATDPHTL